MVSWQGATRGTSASSTRAETGAGSGAESCLRHARRSSWMLRALFAASLAGAWSVAGCGVSKPAGGKGGAGVGGGAGGGGGTSGAAGAGGPAQKLTILHTGDMHSHLMGHSPEADYSPATAGDDATLGGMARLATAIKNAKTAAAAA